MESAAATILLVEDHTPTRRFFADNLLADGYELIEAGSRRGRDHLIETPVSRT